MNCNEKRKPNTREACNLGECPQSEDQFELKGKILNDYSKH